MKNFFSLLGREFKLFWENKVLRLLFLGAPILYGILIGSVYSKGKVTDLPIIVVDEDQSEMTRKAIEMMRDNEVLNVALIQYDKNDLDQKLVDLDAAAVVLFPKDFEKDLYTKKYPEATVVINTSNILTGNYASNALLSALGTLKAGAEVEALRKQGIPESIAMTQYEAFKTTIIRKHNRSTNYMYFLLPGILATVLQQVLLLGLALSFASEFENGTFKDLISRTKSTLSLIWVKVLPYAIMSIGVWAFYLLVAWWFRIPLSHSHGELSIVTGLFVFAVCFMGILVSIIIPNQLKATEVLMVVATPSFILSGFTWPLSQMPKWVVYIADIIPLTHYLKAFRSLSVENGNFSTVIPQIWALTIILIICFALSYFILYFKSRKVRRKISQESN